jgi:hypothetical protein
VSHLAALAKETMCLSDFKDWLGIAGVVIGFALGAGYQELRERGRRKRLRLQLIEEVKANWYSIPQKKATLQSMLKSLGNKKILPGESVPFCEVIYANHYPSFAPFLSLKERNILHVIYSSHRIVDQTMSSFGRDIQSAGAGEPLLRVVKAYTAMLSSLLPDLDVQKRLMESFLDGTPVDVLHMDKSLEELRTAEFEMP